MAAFPKDCQFPVEINLLFCLYYIFLLFFKPEYSVIYNLARYCYKHFEYILT